MESLAVINNSISMQDNEHNLNGNQAVSNNWLVISEKCAHLPVRMLLDHLVDFKQEGFVAESSAHTLLVEAKLGCGYGLALWDLREVELKLLVVTPVRGELPVILHCGMETHTYGESEILATDIHYGSIAFVLKYIC